MTARHLAAGLLAAAALVASPAIADATPLSQPMPEPGRSITEVKAASTVRDSLMQQLLADYAAGQRRSVHNEIVLFRNAPAAAVL